MLALFAIQEEMTEASKGSALGRYLKRNLLAKSSRDSEHRSLEPAMSFRAIQPHLPRTSNDGQRPQTSNTQKAVVVYDSRGNRLYIRFKATRNSYWNRPYTRPTVPQDVSENGQISGVKESSWVASSNKLYSDMGLGSLRIID